jgi:N6-adenosine-specific RNA methylase IME4
MTATQGITVRYRTVLADPWPTGDGPPAVRHGIGWTPDALIRLPIRDIIAADAHLWFWCTPASMLATGRIMAAWSFTYRGYVSWQAQSVHDPTGRRRHAVHLLMIGSRGQADLRCVVRPFLHAPAHHSTPRPVTQYALIERASAGPYLELFGVGSRRGWTTWTGVRTRAADSDSPR